jgi:hypothetical protein
LKRQFHKADGPQHHHAEKQEEGHDFRGDNGVKDFENAGEAIQGWRRIWPGR